MPCYGSGCSFKKGIFSDSRSLFFMRLSIDIHEKKLISIFAVEAYFFGEIDYRQLSYKKMQKKKNENFDNTFCMESVSRLNL